jgi:hypothetical protein
MTDFVWLLFIPLTQFLFFCIWYSWHQSRDPLFVKMRSARIILVVGSILWPLTLPCICVWHFRIIHTISFAMSESPIAKRRRELGLDE